MVALLVCNLRTLRSKNISTHVGKLSLTNLDVLKWWKENQSTFLILSRFALDVLSVPISTISSKSAFGMSGRVLDDRRMSLKSEILKMLTCVKD